MPVPMKKRHTDSKADITWHGSHYSVPLNVLEKYKITDCSESDFETIEEAFGDLINQFGEPAMILRGLRTKEGLSQVEFANAIDVTQQNLSAMENGHRSIGKEIAKRIANKFHINYRLLL
jgi:DNA-binding XRE family transcriptional regulator